MIVVLRWQSAVGATSVESKITSSSVISSRGSLLGTTAEAILETDCPGAAFTSSYNRPRSRPAQIAG